MPVSLLRLEAPPAAEPLWFLHRLGSCQSRACLLYTSSIDPEDLFYAHIGGMDSYALAFKVARQIIADGQLEGFVADRYSSFDSGFGRDIEKGSIGFKELEKLVLSKLGEPTPKSGRQEYLENLLNRYLTGS